MSTFAFPGTTWYTERVPDRSIAGVPDDSHNVLSNTGAVSAGLGPVRCEYYFPDPCELAASRGLGHPNGSAPPDGSIDVSGAGVSRWCVALTTTWLPAS